MSSPASAVRAKLHSVPSGTDSVDIEERMRVIVREELDRSMPFLVKDQVAIAPIHCARSEAQVVANMIAGVVEEHEIALLDSLHFFSAHLGALFAIAAQGIRSGVRLDHAAYVIACQRAGSGSFETQGAILSFLDAEFPVCLEPSTQSVAARIRELAAWRAFFSATFGLDHQIRATASRGASVLSARYDLKNHLDTLRSELTVATEMRKK